MEHDNARKRITLGDLKVPFTEVALSTGETHLLYDTSGPQDLDPRAGLPKRLSLIHI